MQVKTSEAVSSAKLSDIVVQGMLEKKASDVVIMDLREVGNAVADYFILCSVNIDEFTYFMELMKFNNCEELFKFSGWGE